MCGCVVTYQAHVIFARPFSLSFYLYGVKYIYVYVSRIDIKYVENDMKDGKSFQINLRFENETLIVEKMNHFQLNYNIPL